MGVDPKPKSTLDSQESGKKIPPKNGSLGFFSILLHNQVKDLVKVMGMDLEMDLEKDLEKAKVKDLVKAKVMGKGMDLE
tara:strand:+ start:347 stop:583 length:237 start_codon:yes stop_codon:yes gene_type:complete